MNFTPTVGVELLSGGDQPHFGGYYKVFEVDTLVLIRFGNSDSKTHVVLYEAVAGGYIAIAAARSEFHFLVDTKHIVLLVAYLAEMRLHRAGVARRDGYGGCMIFHRRQ